MFREVIKKYNTLFAILLYVLIYVFTIFNKPTLLYNEDGSLREFGIGYRKKTIIPVWLFSILIGIFSYFAITYYIAMPKIRF